MNPKPNLFFTLHHWAHGQDENYTTDAFVYVLQYLLRFESAVGWTILENLTANFLNRDQCDSTDVIIRTQTWTEDFGVPDIEITAPGFLIYVEVKLESGLGDGQIASYQMALEASGIEKTAMVTLTQYPVDNDFDSEVIAIRWYQVGTWFSVELSNQAISQASQFLITQFIGFLNLRGLHLPPIRTPLSEAINEYLIAADFDYKPLTKIRGLRGIQNRSDLYPLYQLLAKMKSVLRNNVPELSFKLMSGGSSRGPWIGFSIANMKYYFFIHYSDPDILVFETLKRKVDLVLAKSVDGQIVDIDGWLRWQNSIDLANPEIAFFNKSESVQAQIIEDFLRTSYGIAIDVSS